MKRRLAIPVLNKQLSPFFGACSHYVLFESDKGNISWHEMICPQEIDSTELPEWLASNGVTDIIAYNIDAEIIEWLTVHKINLFIGISIDSPEKLLDDWLKGNLESDSQIIQHLALTIKR